MARFIGTPQEFYDLFGASLLTKAVNAYTKEYKAMVGRCQDKGAKGIECSKKRHAAHNHENGFSRKSMAMKILNKYKTEDGMIDIDFYEFLKEFYEAHKPLHKTIRVLCSKHHGAYDRGKHDNSENLNDTIYGMPKDKPTTDGNYSVAYVPSEEAIINKLKEDGKCFVHYHMAGGDIVTKPWDNTKTEITEGNLKNNVVSKTFLRKYRKRIERIVVSVYENPENKDSLNEMEPNINGIGLPTENNPLINDQEIKTFPTSEIEINNLKQKSMELQEVVDEIQKVRRRVPGWKKKPYQVNSRILSLFMELSDNGQNGVFLDMLEDEFGTKYPGDVEVFRKNYVQMKNFGVNNHAKVFEEDKENTVCLWAPVKDFIVETYSF